MEKKVLLKTLVESGTNIRREFTPKAVVSDNGKHPVGEFWDANKTIDVIVNNSHEQHDNIRELDEYTHSQVLRLDWVKVSRIRIDDVASISTGNINSLTAGDVVIENGVDAQRAYTVSYKNDSDIFLVYADSEIIKEVRYHKIDDEWVYSETRSFKPEDYYTKLLIDALVENIIARIPTKVSQITNDTGYLTQHQSLSDIISRISTLESKVSALEQSPVEQ